MAMIGHRARSRDERNAGDGLIIRATSRRVSDSRRVLRKVSRACALQLTSRAGLLCVVRRAHAQAIGQSAGRNEADPAGKRYEGVLSQVLNTAKECKSPQAETPESPRRVPGMTDSRGGTAEVGPTRLWARGWPARWRDGLLRERIYGIARVLSIMFVVDGLIMAWTAAVGSYAWISYALFSFTPVFIPAFLVGLVISALYVHRFARQSWTARRTELLFFLLFFLAVAAKVAVVVEARRADQRGASQVSARRARSADGGRRRQPEDVVAQLLRAPSREGCSRTREHA